jgi:hypothetical protein
MPAKSSRYAPSNGVFPRNERMLFNDVTTRLKCKLQAQLQLAVKQGVKQQAPIKV